jgi:hypothetical protein
VYGLYTLATVMSYVPSVAVFEIEECRDHFEFKSNPTPSREAVIIVTGVVALPLAQWLSVT